MSEGRLVTIAPVAEFDIGDLSMLTAVGLARQRCRTTKMKTRGTGVTYRPAA